MESNAVECGVCFADMVVGRCDNCECKLCETCFRNHTRAKMFSSHLIIPFLESYNRRTKSDLETEISSVTGFTKSPVDADIHKRTCKDHTDENQSFYCEKHDVCICGRCVISNHTACMDLVVDLNNISHDAELLKERISTLRELDEEIDRIVSKIEENRQLNDQSRSRYVKEMNAFHEELVLKLKLLITEAQKEGDDLHKQNTDIMDEISLTCKDNRQELRKQIDLLDELECKKHYRHLFVALKKDIVSLKDKNTMCRHENYIKEFEFARNSHLDKIIREELHLGTLTLVCDGSEEVTEHDDQGPMPSTDGSCVICMDTLKNPKTLPCGHIFCRDCLDQQFVYKEACPICGYVCGVIEGDQPDGTMEVRSDDREDCAGFEGCGRIEITYNFPNGIQTSAHPNPGQPYKGIRRTAFLPDNRRGRIILEMLKVAFMRKLVFTFGISRTTGEDVITWNGIHHKTDHRPNTQFGYPDNTYLHHVTHELKVKGITEDDIA